MTTISDIYAGLNPLPAMLSAKGKVKPVVDFRIEANAGVNITLKWQKFGSSRDWDNEYEWVSGPSFEECLKEATARIDAMPSAEQARLQEFMGKLGELIDAGRDEGIDVDYLNPLLDTMKRLSENVITYRPAQPFSHGRGENMKQNEQEFLVELLRWSGAADTREIRGHTSATRQSCKNKGWAEYDGYYWRITCAGRSALHEAQGE